MSNPGKVRSFGLQPGSHIGGYKVLKQLGVGCTAEVYLAVEVLSGAKRSIKIFDNYKDNEHIHNQRRVAKYAKGLERLSGYLLTPTYYHSGHSFITDPLGNYFVVQEYIEGTPLKQGLSGEMIDAFLDRLARAHKATGLVIRDWDKSNLLEQSDAIRLIDADLGTDRGPTGSPRRDMSTARRLLNSFRKT